LREARDKKNSARKGLFYPHRLLCKKAFGVRKVINERRKATIKADNISSSYKKAKAKTTTKAHY
jgi:hypothetical protein